MTLVPVGEFNVEVNVNGSTRVNEAVSDDTTYNLSESFSVDILENGSNVGSQTVSPGDNIEALNYIADRGSLSNVTPGNTESSGYYSSGKIPETGVTEMAVYVYADNNIYRISLDGYGSLDSYSTPYVDDMVYTKDRQSIVAVLEDENQIRVYDIDTGEYDSDGAYNDDNSHYLYNPNSVDVTSDYIFAFNGDNNDQYVHKWDYSNGNISNRTEVLQYDTEDSMGVDDPFDINEDARMLAYVSEFGLHIVDIDTNNTTGSNSATSSGTSVSISPNGDRVAIWDGGVYLCPESNSWEFTDDQYFNGGDGKVNFVTNDILYVTTDEERVYYDVSSDSLSIMHEYYWNNGDYLPTTPVFSEQGHTTFLDANPVIFNGIKSDEDIGYITSPQSMAYIPQ